MRPSFSLGIEEEYQTVDPVTRDLCSHIQTEMLSQGKMRLQERVKAEMHTSVVEVGTRVCRNIDEAREDLQEAVKDQQISEEIERWKDELLKNGRTQDAAFVDQARRSGASWADIGCIDPASIRYGSRPI